MVRWTASNRLQLNPGKTEFLWCSTARRLHLIDSGVFSLGGGHITASTSVRDLGAYFDRDMSMTTHVNRPVSSSFYQLRRIKTIRRSLPTTTAITLINSFVISRIDYCNSLLCGLPSYQLARVQSVLNAAARIIYGGKRFDHVTPLLRDRLHWLRVPERVHFKLCLIAFKALNHLAPV